MYVCTLACVSVRTEVISNIMGDYISEFMSDYIRVSV